VIYITKIHMVGEEEDHAHIAEVQWTNPGNGNTGKSNVDQVVEWPRKPGTEARVTDGKKEMLVGIVETDPPHIRTHADGKPTNNLLALPRY
jgi:hypothetical protein